MIDRFRDVARALVAVLLLGVAGAAAQTAQSPTSQNPGAVSQAGSPTAQAPAQPAGPAGPQINIAEITARANRDVGVNIETAINGWQHELDRLESALQKPRLRYSELNDLRDELQPVPGIYSYQTWAKLPDYVPSATSRVRDLVADWWDSIRDRNEVLLIAFEAVLLWLVLTVAAWHGVRRLRRWRHEGEPPFWRRASSAARLIFLRILSGLASITVPFSVI